MRLIFRILRWLALRPRDVSRAWVDDHERRESGRGIEQSRSTWPWKGWE